MTPPLIIEMQAGPEPYYDWLNNNVQYNIAHHNQ